MGLKKKIGYSVVILLLIGGTQFVFDFGATPDPEIQSTSKPAAETIGKDTTELEDGREFSATLQNSRAQGDIFVSLWLGSDLPEPLPDTEAGLLESGFERVRTGTFYFNGNERRAVTFSESETGNASSYVFYAFARSYFATIRNTGATGDVEISLRWEDSESGESEVVESKTVTVQGGDSRQVELRVTEHPEFHHPDENYDSWNIEVEPA